MNEPASRYRSLVRIDTLRQGQTETFTKTKLLTKIAKVFFSILKAEKSKIKKDWVENQYFVGKQ